MPARCCSLPSKAGGIVVGHGLLQMYRRRSWSVAADQFLPWAAVAVLCTWGAALLLLLLQAAADFRRGWVRPPSRAVNHRFERWTSTRRAASHVPISVGCGLGYRVSWLETGAQGTQRTIITGTGQRKLEPWCKSSKARKVTHFKLSGLCSPTTGI